MDYLKITPLEHVLLETEWDPRDLDSSNILNRLRYWSETTEQIQFTQVNYLRIAVVNLPTFA